MNKKTGYKVVILVNTGTPDSFETKDLRRYLTEFLNDKHVIDIPWLWRKLLVNLIIVPFRAPKSAALYHKLWTENGSPIRFYTENLVMKLNKATSDDVTVYYAMRYGEPSIKKVLEKARSQQPDEIIILPVFPQFASSTTGSVTECVMSATRTWSGQSKIRVIDQFYDNEAFINAFAKKITVYNPEEFDHILFSYHGLPLSHLRKIHPSESSVVCSCQVKMPHYGKSCYKATCYETTRRLAEAIGLREGTFSTSFQSRLTNNWTAPFTDKVLEELLQKGKKKVLVVAPSFVTDCLETIVEIGMEYRENFMLKGGELVLADSLNDSDEWVEALIKITNL